MTWQFPAGVSCVVVLYLVTRLGFILAAPEFANQLVWGVKMTCP